MWVKGGKTKEVAVGGGELGGVKEKKWWVKVRNLGVIMKKRF